MIPPSDFYVSFKRPHPGVVFSFLIFGPGLSAGICKRAMVDVFCRNRHEGRRIAAVSGTGRRIGGNV